MTHTLSDGTTLPDVGFGTYPLRDEEGIEAITSALQAGYRYLDSAVNYQNEREVGEALRRSGLPREEVMVASKVPGRAHAREDAIAMVEASLTTMGLDYIDVFLIHWPNPENGKYVEAFAALLECRERGLIKHAGVSNYAADHLRELIDSTGKKPVLNQIECHPLFPQQEMLATHQELGILTQAWSPLGKREPQYDADPVATVAQELGVSPAQVILRWHVERGVMPLPKSATPERQVANLDVTGFSLSAEQVEAITALGQPDGRLFGGDPLTHVEM